MFKNQKNHLAIIPEYWVVETISSDYESMLPFHREPLHKFNKYNLYHNNAIKVIRIQHAAIFHIQTKTEQVNPTLSMSEWASLVGKALTRIQERSRVRVSFGVGGFSFYYSKEKRLGPSTSKFFFFF